MPFVKWKIKEDFQKKKKENRLEGRTKGSSDEE